MSLFYNILFIPIARLLLLIYKIINKKYRNRDKVCRDILKDFYNTTLRHKPEQKIWFHAASMGEFEQAKPLIEMIKKENPDTIIYVSFFSPSGYDNQKNYPHTDYMFYLPIDTKSNAKNFIELLNPDLAVFIRYEIWFNYLNVLKKKKIPAFLINATMPGSRKIDFYYKKAIKLFEQIYTMNPDHTNYFIDIIKHKSVFSLWDTRFDRIRTKVNDNSKNPLFIKELFNDRLVMVCGSTWQPDENIIIPAINRINEKFDNAIALVIVPHEPTKEHINELVPKLHKYRLLSEIETNQADYIEYFNNNNPVIVVDSIGKLLRIYANANISYVGGAFGVGVHSVTEPAGYGLPVCVGEKYHNSPDAIELEKITVLKSVASEEELYNWVSRLLQNQELIAYISNKAMNYIDSRCGSTQVIFNQICKI